MDDFNKYMGFATICNSGATLPTVNQWNHNPRVGGSSPSSATKQKSPDNVAFYYFNKIIFLDCLNPWTLINPSKMNRFYEMWNYGNTLVMGLQTHFLKHQNK